MTTAPPAQPSADIRPEDRLEAAFTEERVAGLKLGFRVRTVVLGVIAVWIIIENVWPEVTYYLALIAAFWLLGFLPYKLINKGYDNEWTRYLIPFLDMALLSFTLISRNPLDPTPVPYPMKFRWDNELYFMILLMGVVFTYAPRIVLWSGLAGAITWTAGAAWVAMQPDVHAAFSIADADRATSEAMVAAFLDPNTVYFQSITKHVILILLVAGGLAAAVNRARNLVYRHAAAERARTNLSRHFSPNMVDALSERDAALGETKGQQVAVLFADIVGFTTLSEGQAPNNVISMLREFHGRIARTVFEYDGTLDKYLGDGVMATFGTPDARTDDAVRALDCARAIIHAISDWNAERTARGEQTIKVGVGLHFGSVVLGDVGDENRLEYAVIGDTVNVASRFEELPRSLGVDIVASADTIAAAEAGGADAAMLQEFKAAEPQSIRGRSAPVPVRIWRAA